MTVNQFLYMDALINSKIMSLCRLYWSCSREVEGRVRLDAISREVGKWCGEVEQGMRVEEPGTLLVLLDAYEVTRGGRGAGAVACVGGEREVAGILLLLCGGWGMPVKGGGDDKAVERGGCPS